MSDAKVRIVAYRDGDDRIRHGVFVGPVQVGDFGSRAAAETFESGTLAALIDRAVIAAAREVEVADERPRPLISKEFAQHKAQEMIARRLERSCLYRYAPDTEERARVEARIADEVWADLQRRYVIA